MPPVVELKSLQRISCERFSYSNHGHRRNTSKVYWDCLRSIQLKKIVAQKLSLLRVTGVTVRQGGPNVVLDLDVTYSGEAYLGVSVMKVIRYNKKCPNDDYYEMQQSSKKVQQLSCDGAYPRPKTSLFSKNLGQCDLFPNMNAPKVIQMHQHEVISNLIFCTGVRWCDRCPNLRHNESCP